MLSDFTRQNGGTLIVPVSHARAAAESPQLWEGEGAAQPRTDAVHVVAPAGSVCVLDCRVWHCLPPNFTEECRVMYNVRYFPASKCPVDLLCNNGYHSKQPPWPRMPQPTFDALPDGVRWLYAHAPLPPPAPTRPFEGSEQCVDALVPEYVGEFPTTAADAAGWLGRVAAS